MNVLSLFDGMSCGQQALERSGLKIDKYFASEIDKHAIAVTMANYPETIQLGSVVDVNGHDLPKIDLLIGGSPCQSFSFAGKRKGMTTKDEQQILTLNHYLQLKNDGFEFEGQSYLFWEYMRLLTEIRAKNPNVFFLLENVLMTENWEKILTHAIGVHPIQINSSLVSAQNRKRLYWTNIGMIQSGLFGDLESIIKQPKNNQILLKDILESNVDEKYYLSKKMLDNFNNNTKKQRDNGNGFKFSPTFGNLKSKTITTKEGSRMDDNFIICHSGQKRSENRPSIQKNKSAGGTGPLSRNDGKTYCLDSSSLANIIEIGKNNRIRRLTPIECERLQTVSDNYTKHVSDTQRYRMLGNGWTVNVISHVFNYLK